MSERAHSTNVVVVVCVLAASFLATVVSAEVPQIINYQGRLLDSSGDPVADDTYFLKFKIYKSPAGDDSLWWTGFQPVVTTNGAFVYQLGAIVPLPDDLFSGHTQRWLGVTVGADSEIHPRLRLTSVAYAYQALRTDSASYASTVADGSVETASIAADAVTSDEIAADAVGASEIAAGAVGSSGLADNAVNTVKIENGTILFEDIASNSAGTNQVMKWNGSAWVAADDETGGGGGWVDDGNVVRLETAGDSVGIGTSTPSAKLEVSGDLKVDGKATLGHGNTNTSNNSFVAGEWNTVSVDTGTVGGGVNNHVNGVAAGGTIAGGYSNNVLAHMATVSGGQSNTASGDESAVVGGSGNVASGGNSAVGGGFLNESSGSIGVIAGGGMNTASGSYSAILGGSYNRARGQYSTVGGGGGASASDSNSAVEDWSTVSGGKRNIASGYGSIVSGGYRNTAAGNSGTVGGGADNVASGTASTIGGGAGNTADGHEATIGGGSENGATGDYTTVAGGMRNQADSQYATVGGGYTNHAIHIYTTIAGGYINNASGPFSTVGGGFKNIAGGNYSIVSGGISDTASGSYAMVPGGYGNRADGERSFAAGHRAKAMHYGSFVWADRNDADFSSSTGNQFNVRASGGTRIFSNSSLTAGVTLAAGGGSWVSVSNAAAKENVQSVDAGEILEKVAQMPVTEWNYISQEDNIRHIGPMAQDFHAAFGVGEDERGIATIDADGVALAAIKALYERNKELEEELARLKAQLAEAGVLK